MSRRHKIRPVAIACIATTLATGVGAWLVAPHPPRIADRLGNAWIPLPRSGMDARDPNLRDVIRSGGHFTDVDPDDPPLTATCGLEADPSSYPHYRVTIGDGFLRSPSRTWRVDIVIRGHHADVAVREAGIPPFLQPQDPSTATFERWVRPVTTRVLPTRALDGIRTAWDTDEAWHAPQDTTRCTERRESRLEACIAGRYAARDRQCAPSNAKITELWQAILRTVPAPRRGHTEVDVR